MDIRNSASRLLLSSFVALLTSKLEWKRRDDFMFTATPRVIFRMQPIKKVAQARLQSSWTSAPFPLHGLPYNISVCLIPSFQWRVTTKQFTNFLTRLTSGKYFKDLLQQWYKENAYVVSLTQFQCQETLLTFSPRCYRIYN